MARLVADLDGARAEAAARRLHTEMGRLGTAARTVDASFSKAEVGTQQYGRAVSSLQRALNRGVIDQKEYNRLLQVAREKYVDAARGAEKYGESLTKIGREMTSAGAAVSRITVPLLAVGAISVKLASDFESSFAGIRKTVDATEPQFAALALGMRNLSKEIPVNVNELNRIGEAAGQLGIRTENILSFTKTVAALGVTTNLTADEAATSFAKIANITGLPQDQFDRLGSSLVDLGNNFATTEQDIVAFGLRIAGAGEIAGLTEPQILGIGAALSSVGVEAEAGGTAVQKVLLGMVQAVASGGDKLETFARTAGLSAADFAKAFRDDAGSAFASFVMGLGQQGDAAFQTLAELNLTDQRLIRSFLSLAGAGDLVERAMTTGTKAFAENTALAKEAEQRYKTFESQLTLTLNELKDIGITLGAALLPALRDVLSAVRPLVTLAAGLAEKFAALPGPIRATALALGLLAGAAGPAIYVMGSLITAAGTIATTFPKATAAVLALSRSFAAFLANPLTLTALALAGLGLAAREMIERWRSDSENGIAAIIAANDDARESIRDLRAEMAEGLVSESVFTDAVNQSARIGFAIQQEEERLAKARKELKDAEGLDADQLYIARKRANEAIERSEEALANLHSEQVVVDLAVRQAASGQVKWSAAIDVATGSVGEQETSLKHLKAALKEHEKAVREHQKRIQEIESDYKDFEEAIADVKKQLGGLDDLDLSQWVGDNFIAGASAVGLFNGNLAIFLERMSRVPQTAEDWQDLADSIRNADEALGDLGAPPNRIEPPEQTPADVVFPIPGSTEVLHAITAIHNLEQQRVEFSLEIAAALKSGTISIHEAYEVAQSLGIEFEHWTTTLAEGFDAVGAIVGEFDRDLGRALQRAGELVRLYQQAGANLSSGQALGAVAGNVQSANNANYALIGAAVGAAIGTAIGYYFGGPAGAWIGFKWGAVIGSWLGGMIKKGIPEFYGAIKEEAGKAFIGDSALGGGTSKVARAFGDTISKAIDDIMFLIGGELESIAEGIDIKTKKGTSVFVDGLEYHFKEDTEAAISFAITEALKRATITGASPEVIAALANTIARDLDSLFEDLKVAVQVRDLDLQDVQRAFRKISEEADFLTKRAEELGFGLEALERIARSEVRNLGDLRNQILGIEENPADRIRRQAALFNAELALRRADLESRRAELQAKADMLRAQVDLADAGIDIDRAALQAQADLLAAEFGLTRVTIETAASAADVLEEIVGQIAQIDAALAGLANLDITDADIAGAIGRLGGGGGRAADDLERLDEILDRFARERLPSAQRAVAEFDAEWAGYLALAHNNAEAQARLNQEMEEQRRLLNQQLAEDVYSGIRAFEQNPDRSSFRQSIADTVAEAERLTSDFMDLAEALDFGSERIARGLDRISQAEHRRLQSLASREAEDLQFSLLDFLGRSEESERLRFSLQQAELQIRYEELRIAVARYGLEIDSLEAIGGLVAEVAGLDFEGWQRLRTPAVDRFTRSTETASNAAQQLADRLAAAKESIGDFIASLDRGELGGVSPLEGLAAAQAQFDEIFAQAKAGNIDALESFPEAARNLLQLARDAYASGPEFQAIFDMVRQAGETLLHVQRVTSDNVVFDERFFQAQQGTTMATVQGAERTAGAVHEGADRTVLALEALGRAVSGAVDRQGDRQGDRLGKIQASLEAALAGQQRLKGAA